MLLPSALTCDTPSPAAYPRPALQQGLFASPPASPPTLLSGGSFSNIFTTCRTLQSLLAAPAPPALDTTAATAFALPTNIIDVHNTAIITPEHHSYDAPAYQLPTPPMTHAAPPPFKLRLRPRRVAAAAAVVDGEKDSIARRRIVKRTARGTTIGKRRRVSDGNDDDDGNNDEVESDLDISSSTLADPFVCSEPNYTTAAESEVREVLTTPKRSRIAPEVLPLGLDRSDFHQLHASQATAADERDTRELGKEGTDVVIEEDGEKWSYEDDRILVELVLEKLKLSKAEWNDCARSLGKDRNSVGRRWKSLMMQGEIGLKHRRQRGKIHGTWR